MRLGLLGGTFNPIHYGHLRAAEECREALGLEQVLFIPAGTPPLKSSGLAIARDRLEMAALAVQGNPAFKVLPIEAERPGKSFTIDTLRELRSIYPGAVLHFIIGVEAFLELHLWREAEALFRLARFVIIRRPPAGFLSLKSSRYLKPSVLLDEQLRAMDMGGGAGICKPDTSESNMCEPELSRELSGAAPGVTLLRTTPVAISATGIRERIAAGLSIRYMLPETVESFIMTRRLYFDADKA